VTSPAAVERAIRGVPVGVVNSRPDIDTERVFRRAEAVLALVERYVPARFRHLRRDLAMITVERFPCRGAYLPDRRACLLELTFMANESFSDAQVAATLVHEAMHARLDRLATARRIRRFDQDAARHERLCREAELEFGRAVPDGAPVVARALASLALDDEGVAPRIDWREAARRVADVDATARRSDRERG
jgi:hypothetical protein